MQESVSKNYIFSLLYQLVNIIIQVITLPYVARILGAEGVGIQSYTNSVVSIFSIIGVLGINWYGQRNIARVMDDKEKKTLLFVELSLFKIINCTVVLSVYIGYLLVNSKYLIFGLAQIVLYVGNMLDISWYFQGIEKFKIVAIRNCFVKIIGIVLIFSLVKEKEDVLLYILILSLSTLIGNLALWLRLKNELVAINIKMINIKRHFKDVLYYFIPTVATSVYLLMDKAMIGAFLDSADENGYYEQAVQILNMIKTLFLSYNSVMVSRMTFLFKNNKQQEIKFWLDRTMNLFSYLSYAMFFGLIMVCGDFITLYYGQGNEKTEMILYAFSASIIFVSLSSMLESHIITPIDARRKGNVIVTFGALINLIINFILIPKLGAYGAAIASSFAEGAIAIGYIIVSKKFFTVTEMIKLTYKKIISGLIMYVCIMNFNIDNAILNIILKVVVGFLVYNVVLLLLKDNVLYDLVKKERKS